MSDRLKQTSQCLGYAQYTTTNTAFALTSAPATGVTLPASDPSNQGNRPACALLQAEVHDMRWRDDGTSPTASVGMILIAGDAPFLYDGDLSRIKLIQTASGSILNVSYFI